MEGDGVRRTARSGKQAPVRRRDGERLARKLTQRRAGETAKGVGLRGPIQIPERRREAVEMMLGGVVVPDGDRRRIHRIRPTWSTSRFADPAPRWPGRA